MQCRKCGRVEECPHCSVAMTYHRTDETLRCHLCGEQRPAPGSLSEVRRTRYPMAGSGGLSGSRRRCAGSCREARIERIDSDTMGRKNRFREILGKFRLGKIDVLVGTQMIGKGLDFPNVTVLVGVIDADPVDARAEFQSQRTHLPAPRPGRGPGRPERDREGHVVVQDFHPGGGSDSVFAPRGLRWICGGRTRGEKGVRLSPASAPDETSLFAEPNPDKLKFFAETSTSA